MKLKDYPRIIRDFYNLSLSRLLGLIAFSVFLFTIIKLILNNLIFEAAQFSGGLFSGIWAIKIANKKIKDKK